MSNAKRERSAAGSPISTGKMSVQGFWEPIPDGKYKGFTIAKWLPDLVYEYYRLFGCHERTGRPFKNTLDQLGLEEFTRWSQEAGQL
jgi:aldehyde:ferredoxin oxidoreductase